MQKALQREEAAKVCDVAVCCAVVLYLQSNVNKADVNLICSALVVIEGSSLCCIVPDRGE